MGILRRSNPSPVERSDEQRHAVRTSKGFEKAKERAQRGNAKNDARAAELEAKAGKGDLSRSELKELKSLRGLE